MPEVAVQPAHLWVPERVGSYGDEAVDLARMAGRDLDAEQAQAVDAKLSYGPGGRWLALESAIVEARQNGKTAGVLLPVTLFDLFLLPPDRICWTAHLFKTARDAFSDFIACIEYSSELSRRIKKINSSHGEEGIYLTNGACLEFLARSKGGGRGLGGKRLVMDEALFLAAAAMGALIPTLAARSVNGDPQINYGASAGLATSDHLRRIRDRGRKGGDPSLIYVEYCAPGSWQNPGCADVECLHSVDAVGCALDNEELWPHANHAIGRRISYDYIRKERRALPPEEFGRERLGWWDEPADMQRPITGERWGQLADLNSGISGQCAFAIDANPGLSMGSIDVAGRRIDGKAHVEITGNGAGVLDHRRGVDWIPARIMELVDDWSPTAVAIDPSSPAGALIPALEEAGLKVTNEPKAGTREVLVKMTPAETAQACGVLLDLVNTDNLRHPDQGPLNSAVSGAVSRDRGDGAWTWSRKNSLVDISPLVAATEALWAFSVFGIENDEYDIMESIG